MVFVLLARQRSGTGAVGSVLDQHPQLKYLGECFNPDNLSEQQNFFKFYINLVREQPERCLPRMQQQNFKDFLCYLKNEFGENLVIDIKYNSTHYFNGDWFDHKTQPVLIALLKQLEIPIIHLQRKNYVKTYVSGKLAELNKVWHASSEIDVRYTSLNVDVVELICYLKQTQYEVVSFNSYLEKYPNVLELEYNDLFDSFWNIKLNILEDISNFLKIEPFSRNQPVWVKQAPKFLKDSIDNFEDITQSLEKTEFSWMMRE